MMPSTSQVEKCIMSKTSTDKRTFFSDQIEVSPTQTQLVVTHSHWLERRLNFSVAWDAVTAIQAIQVDSFDMSLVFIDEEAKEYQVIETMLGWSSLLMSIKKRFPTFDWSAFEDAKGRVHQPFLCWSKNVKGW